MKNVILGVNDLETTHPELAKQADGWDPKSVIAGTGKKLNWICEKGHRWDAAGSTRVKGSGCPVCVNQKLLVGYNDLATTNPELAKEADGWDPRSVLAGTNKKLNWKCSKGHKWTAQGNDRSSGKNCPFCSNHRVLAGYNDLATTHPELAKEAHGWDPKTVSAGSVKNRNWKCANQHKWKVSPNARTSKNTTGCPSCRNRKVLAGFNDLATTHPELAKEAHGWDPTKIIAGSEKKVEWECERKHIWEAPITNRTRLKSGCPYCINQKVLPGFNDLATTHPELANEAHGWDPTKILAGSAKKLDWKCFKDHIWSATGNSRTSKNPSGCPTCGNRKVLSGFNDLATTHPELAKEAHGWDPTKISAGSEKKVEWECEKKHIWEARIDHRATGSGCSICSNLKVLTGFNDLATTHPQLALQALGWNPNKTIAGTNKKLKWKCSEGHVWITTGSNRVAGFNCPSCAKTGFDPNINGYLYFLIQPSWEIYQIGISNYPEKRLISHKNNGFELLELRGPMDGHTAQELETALLRYLKSQKADLSPEHIAGKFDGYTESWTIDSYKVNNLKELIDKASEAGF
jgi:hypothetical protein